MGGKVGVHPNDNTAAIWINTDNIINIIKEHRNEVEVIENIAVDEAIVESSED